MYQYPDYLMHYGVPGMKWGVRKQRTYDTSTAYGRMKTAKQQYKSDKKAYSKSFNKAYYHNHAYSLSKKKRQASADRWNDAIDKSRTLNSSKKAYKSAKKEYKDYKRNLNKGKSSKAKIAAGVAGVVVASALATYGTYKFSKFVGLTNYKYHLDLGEKKVRDHMKSANDRFSYGVDKDLFRKAQRNTEHAIFNNEVSKAYSDTFGQAVKNTVTYYKDRKRR